VRKLSRKNAVGSFAAAAAAHAGAHSPGAVKPLWSKRFCIDAQLLRNATSAALVFGGSVTAAGVTVKSAARFGTDSADMFAGAKGIAEGGGATERDEQPAINIATTKQAELKQRRNCRFDTGGIAAEALRRRRRSRSTANWGRGCRHAG